MEETAKVKKTENEDTIKETSSLLKVCSETISDDNETSNNSKATNIIDADGMQEDSGKVRSPKFIVNDQLKDKLEKHGISKKHAEDFLLGFLLRDKDFKNLVKANLTDENSSDDEAVDVRMTRSKLKEVMQNSPFKDSWAVSPTKNNIRNTAPIFTEIPLSENDDDDEEYKPTEVSFGSDTQDTPKYQMTGLTSGCTIEDINKEVDNSVSGLAENGAEHDISKRTRSKHSLESTSIDTLEAAFDPPDATADMYDINIGDYDWQKWLSDLMKDVGVDNVMEDEDDPIADPDFYFTPDLEEPDKEDFRDDSSVRVSKKELHGLLDEVEHMRNDSWEPVFFPVLNDSIQSTGDSEDCTAQAALSKKDMNSDNNNHEIQFLQMTEIQVEKLKQQLCQHVQLLVQSNILSRNRKDFEEYITESKQLLQELMDIGLSQLSKLGFSESVAIPWSLKEAIHLTEIEIPVSEPSIRLVRMERMKGHVSIPLAVAEVISNSNVFMYKELLPTSAPAEHGVFSSKLPFRPAEDCLIASGMAQMAGLPNYAKLISEHMLPTKTEKQILSRIRNVVYCRNQKDTVNPIRKYQTCRLLPKSRMKIKYITQQTAKKPISMKGMLPNWLLALKPVHIPEDSSDSFSQDELCEWGVDCVQSTPNNVQPKVIDTQCIMTSSPLKDPYEKTTDQCSSTDIVVSITPVPKDNREVFSPVNSNKINTPVKIFPKNMIGMYSPKMLIGHCVAPNVSSATTVTSNVDKPNTSISQSSNILSLPVNNSHVSKHRGKLIKMQSEYDSVTVLSSDDDTEENIDAIQQDEAEPEENPACTIESEDDFMSDNDISSKQKAIRVRLSKTDTGYINAMPSGGFMRKVHPKLTGRKSKSSSRDLRRLRNVSKNVQTLEEDTIVQLDPRRMEKEQIFAEGYQCRVEDALKDRPEIYRKYLETLVKYSEGTNSPIDLYVELSNLLHDWPDLVQAFAPFLMPDQAHECGLHTEQEIYFKARKFLRQLELQFSDNPDTMNKILDVFHNVASTALYREEEMMKSILLLLKGHPYLQDEFVTFFDRTHPPKINFDNDFEEVDLSEELIKDPYINQYEQVTLPDSEEEGSEQIAFAENNLKRGRKRRISPDFVENSKRKSPPKSILMDYPTNGLEHSESATLYADDEEEALNTDYESDDEMNDTDMETLEPPAISVPPDITVISEDALSSSPFKRITEETLKTDDLSRPDTPTGIRSDNTRTHSITFTNSPTSPLKRQNNDILSVPVTPTGKIRSDAQESEKAIPVHEEASNFEDSSEKAAPLTGKISSGTQDTEKAMPVHEEETTPTGDISGVVAQETEKSMPVHEEVMKLDDSSITWTHEKDELILTLCREHGETQLTFNLVSKKLNCDVSQVESRWKQLLQLLFTGGETDTSHESGEESCDSNM